MNLFSSEEATNFKARGVALSSARQIDLAGARDNRRE
jgi:hypothetical protein